MMLHLNNSTETAPGCQAPLQWLGGRLKHSLMLSNDQPGGTRASRNMCFRHQMAGRNAAQAGHTTSLSSRTLLKWLVQ